MKVLGKLVGVALAACAFAASFGIGRALAPARIEAGIVNPTVTTARTPHSAKRTWVGRLNVICTWRQSRLLPAVRQPVRTPAAAESLLQSAIILDEEAVAALERLDPPTELRSAAENLKRIIDDSIATERRMLAALQGGDAHAFRGAFQELKALDRRLNRVFKRLGAASCADERSGSKKPAHPRRGDWDADR